MQKNRRILLLPIMVLLALGFLLLLGSKWFYDSTLARKRAEVETSLAPYGNALTTTLNQQLGLTEALTAFVQGHPDPQNLRDHFSAYASGLISNSNSVRAIQIFPPAGSVLVYPIAGNEETVTRTLADLLSDDRPQVRADIERAINTRRPVLSEPYALRQGGLGLVMRQAVFHDDTLWGFSVVILDIPQVITAAGLNNPIPNLRIALRSSEMVLHGDPLVLSEDPVIYTIHLADHTWELAAVPINGWQDSIRGELLQFVGAGSLIILLIVYITYRLSSYQVRLRTAVQERTIELARELAERKQSEEQVRRLHRVLTMLSEITQSIVRNNDIPALMSLACDVAVKRGGYELAWVGLISPNLQKMRAVASAGRATDLLQEIDLAPDLPPDENDPIRRAVHTGQHVIHIPADQQFTVPPGLKSAVSPGFASMASFPLIVGERVRGTLNLYAGTPNHFDESELKMLDDLVKDLSFAIAHNEEEEQRRWAEAETLQINRLYQVLSQVNQSVLRAATREDLFRNVCQILVEQGHFKLAWVGWVDPASQRIQTAAQWGDTTGEVQHLSIPISDPDNQSGPLCAAVQNGRAYISIDFNNTLWKNMASEVGFEAMGSFPLRLNGVVQGALTVHIDNRDYFRIREINLLQEVADDISFALDHQLQEQLRARADLALIENNRLLTALINSTSNIIIFSLDRNYRYTTFNQKHRLEMRTIWNADIHIGDNILEFMTIPQLREAAQRSFDRALAGEAFSEIQHQPDADIYYEFVWNPIRDENGTVTGLTAFVLDITEQRRAAAAVEESERRYRLAQRAAQIGSWEWDIIQGRLTWSDEMYVIFDKDPNSFVPTNQAVIDSVIDEDKPRALAAVQATMTNGVPFQIEYRILDRNQNVRWLEARGEIIYDDHHRPLRAVGTIQNITARKQTEEALRESENRYRQLFLSNPHPMWVYDLETLQFLEVNDSAVYHYGYSRSEFLAMTIKDIRPEEDVPALLEDIANAHEVISPARTWRHRLKDGRIRYVEISSHELNYAGRPARLVLALDITERKIAEEKLRESEERYRNILMMAPIGIAIHQDGKIVFTNPAGLRLLGAQSFEQLIGKDIRSIIHPDNLERSVARVQRMIAGEEGLYPVEDKYIRLDGTVIDVEVMATKLTYQGRPAVQVLVTDITESKRIREELIAWNARLEQRVAERTAQLEASNKELEAFAYSVSHDLRAPLRAIDGFSRILQQQYAPVLDEEGQRLLAVVRNSTNKMDHLITDLLALSRVSRNQLNYMRINMNALVDSVYHEVASPEVQPAIVFTCQNLPEAAADITLMRQVWANLISNAIKYTSPKPDRHIDVSGYEKDNFCFYQITDNGVGFNPRYSDKLFGVFQRLHKESEFEGTGVGLAIVQRIVHRHGGQVWASGEIGQGATFTFSLPKRQVNDE